MLAVTLLLWYIHVTVCHLIHYHSNSVSFIRSCTRGCWINMGSVGGLVWSSPNDVLIC